MKAARAIVFLAATVALSVGSVIPLGPAGVFQFATASVGKPAVFELPANGATTTQYTTFRILRQTLFTSRTMDMRTALYKLPNCTSSSWITSTYRPTLSYYLNRNAPTFISVSAYASFSVSMNVSFGIMWCNSSLFCPPIPCMDLCDGSGVCSLATNNCTCDTHLVPGEFFPETCHANYTQSPPEYHPFYLIFFIPILFVFFCFVLPCIIFAIVFCVQHAKRKARMRNVAANSVPMRNVTTSVPNLYVPQQSQIVIYNITAPAGQHVPVPSLVPPPPPPPQPQSQSQSQPQPQPQPQPPEIVLPSQYRQPQPYQNVPLTMATP